MITSVVGRLIKKPELVERIHIPGKRVVAFTIVQNSQRGEKRLSVFFNLTMVIATEAQFEMVMRFEKGTVLLFSSPRITYVKQVDRDEHEQVINLYAEIDNFRIVAGAQGMAGDASSSPHPADAAGFEEMDEAPLPQQQMQQRRAAGQQAPAASSRPEAPGRAAATQRPMPSARPNPPRTAAPPDDFEDDDRDEASPLLSADALSDLSDPFEDEPPPAPARRPATGASPPRVAAPAPAQAGEKRTPPPAAPQNRQNQPRPRRQEPQEPTEDDDPFA